MTKNIWGKLGGILGVGKNSSGPEYSQVWVGAAALMIQVADEHEGISEEEKNAILSSLSQVCGGSGAAVEIFEQGAQLQAQATDLYCLTRVIMKHTTHEEQCEMVRLLYRVGFADDDLDHFEEHIIARIAGLLGVEVRDRVRIRQEVCAER